MSALIKDGERLVGVYRVDEDYDYKTKQWTPKRGREIHSYDDGFGPLWVLRDSMGICGVVRAQTFEDAYNICEDEIFPGAEDTWEQIAKDFDALRPDGTIDDEKLMDDGAFQESYGFRPNGQNDRDQKRGLKTGLYQKDLNGEDLSQLTPKLADELKLTIEVESEE